MNPHKDMNYTEEDRKRCPVYKKKMEDSPFKERITMQSMTEQSDKESLSECPYKNNLGGKLAEVEEENEGGGCPVMKVKKAKRNPPLYTPTPEYSVVYTSVFSDFLGDNALLNLGGKNKAANKEAWNSYPIFLKNTLFYYTDQFKKYRGLEVGYKFFATDELKENANEDYFNGDIESAISKIEKGIAMLRWLDCEPVDIPKLPNLGDLDRDNIEHEIKECKGQADNTVDRMTKLMFTDFNDENVTLREKVGIESKSDLDMYNNVLFNLYSCLFSYYLKGRYYKEARQTHDELSKINSSSLVLYKKVQLIMANAESTVEELQEGIELIDKAKQLKKEEEIFKHNRHFLTTLNLANHEEAFDEIELRLTQELLSKKESSKAIMKSVLERANEIAMNELDIIKRGLTPTESEEYGIGSFYKCKNFEQRVIDGLVDKYKMAIHFYANNENKEQLQMAKKAYQQTKKLQNEFNTLWCVEFDKLSKVDKSVVQSIIQKQGYE